MITFARSLKNYPNSLVRPVILSGRGNWHFEPNEQEQNSGKLTIQGEAAIVDGQERIGGFVHLYESEGEIRNIPFIFLPDLTLEQEIEQFVILNHIQKAVPKPLTSYLNVTDEAQIALGLNEETNGPFTGRITKTSLKPTHLFALHSVAKQVKRLFSLGDSELNPHLDINQKIEIMSGFWKIIADQLPKEWSDIEKLDDPDTRGRRDFEYKLLELTGLIAWTHTGAQIFSRSYNEKTGMNWDQVRHLVEAASGIDWHKGGEYEGRTGEVGGRVMADEMIRLLPAEVPEVSLQQALS